MQLHGSIIGALQHASTWSALSALFAASASQLPAPYQQIAVAGGVGCGVLGILLRSPGMDHDDIKEQCDADRRD